MRYAATTMIATPTAAASIASNVPVPRSGENPVSSSNHSTLTNSVATHFRGFLYGLAEAYSGRGQHAATHDRADRCLTGSAGMAAARAVPGRSRRGGGRRSTRAEHVLLRLVRRRRVEDHRRRALLAQRDRRLLPARIGRRDRGRAVPPERRLRRDGRGGHPRQRVPPRRRPPPARWGQDLGAPPA